MAVIWGGTTAALAESQQAPVPLDQLIERFNATAPEVEDGVRLDAWVEQGAGGRQLVVLVEPKGETKLIADPGITVTPIEQVGVEWLVPLPHRHVDPAIEYFEPPAAIRLPFATDDERGSPWRAPLPVLRPPGRVTRSARDFTDPCRSALNRRLTACRWGDRVDAASVPIRADADRPERR